DRRLFFASWYAASPRGYIVDNQKYVYWPYNNKVFLYDLQMDPREENPRLVEGSEKDRVIGEVTAYIQESLMTLPPKRFRQKLLFDHWRTFASGRSAWAYYVP
ncbi:MAG TPA: hypothetical protein VLM89_08150, partial [Phycisphaerae bacterium]|nr:hypothetical protein [Phycisphaerae bacterium]